jgi:hypothetical protein
VEGIWLVVRARGRIVSTLLLVGAIAVGAGAVLTAFAGARRTSSAFDRLTTAAKTADVSASPALDPAVVRRLPEVAAAGREAYVFLSFPDFADHGSRVVPFAAGDDDQYSTVDRGVLLAGRRADPTRAGEVMISPAMATRRHLAPGSHVRIQNATLGDVNRVSAGGELGVHGPIVDLTVVGVMREPIDLAAAPEDQDVEYLGGSETTYLTPAFSRTYIEPILGHDYLSDGGVSVRLVHGSTFRGSIPTTSGFSPSRTLTRMHSFRRLPRR